MSHRRRPRRPRDLAVREPYEPETPAQEQARKLDALLGLAVDDTDGFRVVSKRKPMNDPEIHKPKNGNGASTSKPSMKEVLTGVAAKAALDSIMHKPAPIEPEHQDADVEFPDDGSEESPEVEENIDDEPPVEEATRRRVEAQPKKAPETAAEPEETEDEAPEPSRKSKKHNAGRGLGRMGATKPVDKKRRARPAARVEVPVLPPEPQPEPATRSKKRRPEQPRAGAVKDGKPRKATPLTPKDLTRVVKSMPLTKRWIRNRALLLLGLSAGLRRSELVAVRLEGMCFEKDGLVLAIRGIMGIEKFVIPRTNGRLCTVTAVARWIASSKIKEGYLFRLVHDGRVVDIDPDKHIPSRHVDKIVKSAAKLAGLDPSLYSGRSLRSGYAEMLRLAAERAARDIDSVRRYMRPRVVEN